MLQFVQITSNGHFQFVVYLGVTKRNEHVVNELK